jgi:hydroxyacylglutathione hydrolase
MIIKAFPSGPFETNAFIIACPETRLAVVIDPAPGSFLNMNTYLTENQLTPLMILLTHSHWDHIGDTSFFKKNYKIPVYVHALDAANLEKPGVDRLPLFIEIEGVKPDHFLNDNDVISIGNLELVVIWTPGHTPGGVCFFNPQNNVLISGDTLFKGSIGSLSFPTAQPELMWPSLERLGKLPPATKVYPGHGTTTTIGAEVWLANPKKYFSDQ